MLEFFGARSETGIKSKSYKCSTIEELEEVLSDEEFAKAESINLCEIVMDQFDYPWRLNDQLVIGRARAKELAASFSIVPESK